jgi:hypothetical protein
MENENITLIELKKQLISFQKELNDVREKLMHSILISETKELSDKYELLRQNVELLEKKVQNFNQIKQAVKSSVKDVPEKEA